VKRVREPSPLVDEDGLDFVDKIIFEAGAAPNGPAHVIGTDSLPGSPVPPGSSPVRDRSRSRSASTLPYGRQASASLVFDSQHAIQARALTPVVEEEPAEREARLGPVVQIQVEMVSDPRNPQVESNEGSRRAWEAPMLIDVRQVRANPSLLVSASS
jgi:hypothetical protein